jgi:hypothetical protein
MDELKFVLKCLAFTALLVVLMQVKVRGYSVEAYSFHWLRTSKVSHYMQSVAAGGAMAVRSLGHTVKDGVANTVEGFNEGSSEKAIR